MLQHQKTGTETNISKQTEHQRFSSGNGDKAHGFPWRKFAGFILVLVLLVTGGAIIWLAEDSFEILSGEAIATYIKSWGIWGYLGLVGLMIAHSFIPFPAEFIAMAAGMSFGIIWGTVLTWTGAMIGGLLAFGISRKLGRPFMADILTPSQLAKIDTGSAMTTVSAMIAVRLVPVIAFNLVNYGAGLTDVSWWRFTWTTAIGILPLTTLMVVIGEQMRDPTLADWIALFGAGLLMIAIVHFVRRFGVTGPK